MRTCRRTSVCALVIAGCLPALLMIASLPAGADFVDIVTNADAYVAEDGSSGTGNSIFAGADLQGNIERGLLNFDTSNIAALENARVTRIQLVTETSLWTGAVSSPSEIALYEVNGGWTESTVTWATRPTAGARVGTDVLVVDDTPVLNATWEIPVSFWDETSSLDFYLAQTDPGTQNGEVGFYSRESSGGDAGYLHVEYVPEPGTMALMGIGLAGLAFIRRRRRQ